MKKQTLKGCVALSAALCALAPVVRAADTMAPTTTMSTSSSMAAQPMMVTGRVNNYWTDASGYVTAVDVQTANGPAVVRFAPGMGNRVMQAYPVGSTANVWVQGSTMNGVTNWDLVGMGEKMPASGFYPVMTMGPLDLVTGSPMIEANAERVTVEGNLSRVVVDNMGQVVGLIVDTKMVGKGTAKNHLGTLQFGPTVWQASTGGAPAWTLIRVGPEFRPTPSHGNMRRVTPLLAGDDIVAVGYMEASRYGAISPIGNRLIATGITVNSQSVGEMGFPTMKPKEPVLFNFNLNLPLITGKAPSSLEVVPGGYEVYNGSSGMMGGTMAAPTSATK